jgi:hypothetical protein
MPGRVQKYMIGISLFTIAALSACRDDTPPKYDEVAAHAEEIARAAEEFSHEVVEKASEGDIQGLEETVSEAVEAIPDVPSLTSICGSDLYTQTFCRNIEQGEFLKDIRDFPPLVDGSGITNPMDNPSEGLMNIPGNTVHYGTPIKEYLNGEQSQTIELGHDVYSIINFVIAYQSKHTPEGIDVISSGTAVSVSNKEFAGWELLYSTNAAGEMSHLHKEVRPNDLKLTINYVSDVNSAQPPSGIQATIFIDTKDNIKLYHGISLYAGKLDPASPGTTELTLVD